MKKKVKNNKNIGAFYTGSSSMKSLVNPNNDSGNKNNYYPNRFYNTSLNMILNDAVLLELLNSNEVVHSIINALSYDGSNKAYEVIYNKEIDTKILEDRFSKHFRLNDLITKIIAYNNLFGSVIILFDVRYKDLIDHYDNDYDVVINSGEAIDIEDEIYLNDIILFNPDSVMYDNNTEELSINNNVISSDRYVIISNGFTLNNKYNYNLDNDYDNLHNSIVKPIYNILQLYASPLNAISDQITINGHMVKKVDLNMLADLTDLTKKDIEDINNDIRDLMNFNNTTVINKDDDMSILNIEFNNLKELMIFFQDAIAAVVNIPASRLWQREQSGLSENTGKGDLIKYGQKIYNERIKLMPFLDKFFSLIRYEYILDEDELTYKINEVKEDANSVLERDKLAIDNTRILADLLMNDPNTAHIWIEYLKNNISVSIDNKDEDSIKKSLKDLNDKYNFEDNYKGFNKNE